MTKTPAPSTPVRLDFFGPPPLLEGEDSAAYNELLARVSGAVKPTDILEEIWVRDFVDLTWEIFRLRCLKPALIAANAHIGASAVLFSLSSRPAAGSFAADTEKRDSKGANEQLVSANHSMDVATVHTFSACLTEIERIDRMTMNAEARRSMVLCEVERHRARLAQAMRQVSDEIEDAQFEETKAPHITKRKAA